MTSFNLLKVNKILLKNNSFVNNSIKLHNFDFDIINCQVDFILFSTLSMDFKVDILIR